MTGNNQYSSKRTEIEIENIARVDSGSHPKAFCTDLGGENVEEFKGKPATLKPVAQLNINH
jgi:hypothetical protein